MEYKKIPSVTRVPLSERVYKILMESIVSGDLLPGTELREQHVAKQMGVSATPVREAFKRLASDGMIELIPYRGAVDSGRRRAWRRSPPPARNSMSTFIS